MGDPQKALATQLANIEARTGTSLAEFTALVQGSGLAKHGEIRDLLRAKFDLGYGDANTLAHMTRQGGSAAPAGAQAPADGDPAAADPADALYTGPKAALRPIHDELMRRIRELGDFEVAPKQTYLSLRRKKQFAMIGPATKSQVEVGLNVKELPAADRLTTMPPKSMCTYKTRLADVGEVDAELLGWLARAYDEAG